MARSAGTAAEISVIIVNYNTAALALAAVESVLARDHGGRRVDVHLVDNASPLGDGDTLRAAITARGWLDRVTLYAETVNHGFGRGNNLVLEALCRRPVPPDLVFLLNPDARLENEAIKYLADRMKDNDQIGAAGARTCKATGEPSVSAFRFPSIIGEFAKAVNFGPINRRIRRWDVPMDQNLGTTQVNWVSGAAVMLRMQALREVCFFDPNYFLYYEETDLMLRMARAGWETWRVAEALVVHIEGEATEVRSGELIRKRRPSYWYHSWYIFFSKNHGRFYALSAAAAWVSGVWINHIVSFIRGKAPSSPLFFLQDFWRVAVRPILGLKAQHYD